MKYYKKILDCNINVPNYFQFASKVNKKKSEPKKKVLQRG